MRNLSLTLCALWTMTFAMTGCQGTSANGDIDKLVDADNDGFADITPPNGVAFDDATNAKVLLTNSIGVDDIGPLAQQQGIDPALLNFVDIEVNIVMTLAYEGFENLVLRQSQDLEPFERAMEAACPDQVLVNVNVVANAPIVGPQDVFSGEFEQTQGEDFQCGDTISVETFINDAGFPNVDVSAQ